MDDHVLEQAETIYRGETPVGVKVAFTDEGWISDEAETRAGNSLNGGTFSLGTNSNTNSAVALCVDNGSGTYSSFKYGVTANSTTLTAPATPPYFPIGGATIHAYARYPYVSSIGWNGTTFSVNADQSTDANYCMSDLMLTDGLTQTRTLNTSTGISWNNTSVTLPFKHKLTKISMSIVIPNDITVTKVELLNVNRTVNLTSSTSNNVVTNNVGTTLTNSGAVTVYSNSTGAKNTTLNVAAIITPQTVSNSNFIRITESGGNTITYKLASKQFKSGYAYTVKVTLTKTQLGQTFNIPAWAEQSLTVNINIAQNNQITLGTHTQNVTVASGGSKTTDNIAVSNSKGTLSWDATSSTVTGITPNISGKNVNFTITSAVPVGTYTYILRDTPSAGSEYSQSTAAITIRVGASGGTNTGNTSAIISVTIGTSFGSHEAVQLWDDGPYWATTNIGASTETDYGNYYAWGETSTKTDYSSSTYTYSDNPNTLDSTHDAATKNWGSGWRMPTKAEFDDLFNYTNHSWVTINGVNGIKFVSKTDSSKYIFLPPAGGYDGTSLNDAGPGGYYWSSSISSSNAGYAWYMYFHSGDAYTGSTYRYNGFTVRPVHN